MKINEINGLAIIISANGMCSAGRIKHHLKHNLWRPGASVIIAGFQAQGSTGRQIVDGAKAVTIFGEKVAVRAKVFTIGGLSAHADQADLLAWVGHFSKKSSPTIFVTHGEPTSSQTLATKIKEKFGLSAYVPKWREVLTLDHVEAVHEILPEPVSVDLRRDMLTLADEIEAEISRFKEQIAVKAPKITEEDLEKLRDIREELQTVISG
jgi:metallo-beta-lactamase family protein